MLCVISGNVHVLLDWYGHTIRQLLECCLATKILNNFVESLAPLNNGLVVPHILCGDFNIQPNFPAYRVISTKTLTDDDCKALENFDYLKLSSDAMWPDPPKGKVGKYNVHVIYSKSILFLFYTRVQTTVLSSLLHE